MVHSQLDNAISDSFPSPTLPKQPGKSSYGSIRDTHCLLTANAASINIPCGGVQNSHLGIVLTTTQYAFVSLDSFIFPTDPGRTPSIPAWETPFGKKALLCENAEKRQKYNECCKVDATLRDQLLTAFEDTYLSPLKNAFTGYSGATTLNLISQLYAHYVRILAIDLAENNRKLQETFNLDKPLKRLYTRLNECVDYATAEV